MPLRGGGVVRIVATSGEGVLRVAVTDTGTGLSTKEYGGGNGIGLSNIRSRLATLYRGDARLTLRGNSPHGVAAAIDVPLRLDEDGATDDDRDEISPRAPDSHRLAPAA